MLREHTGKICIVALAVLGLGCDEGIGDRGIGDIGDVPDGPADNPLEDHISEPDELPPVTPIYGGTDVASCGWPTAVNLGGSCTGTLVHEDVVIYAAHCGTNFDYVRFGENAFGGNGRWVQTEFCTK